MKKQWEYIASVREDAPRHDEGSGEQAPVRQGRPAGLVAHADRHTRSDPLGGFAMRAPVLSTTTKDLTATALMSGWGRRGRTAARR